MGISYYRLLACECIMAYHMTSAITKNGCADLENETITTQPAREMSVVGGGGGRFATSSVLVPYYALGLHSISSARHFQLKSIHWFCKKLQASVTITPVALYDADDAIKEYICSGT